MKGKVLIILTGSTQAPLLNGTENKTGVDIRTLMEPMEVILNAGYKVRFATPSGRTPVFDVSSTDSLDPILLKEYKQILADLGHFYLPLNISEISEESLSLYDGLFIAGGFGALSDLKEAPGMRPVIKHFKLHKKPIGAIAQGVLGLTYPLREGEDWVFKGYKMTSIPKASEKSFVKPFKKEKLTYSVTEILETYGGKVKHGKTVKKAYLQEHEMLITAQDEDSSEKFAEAFKDKLNEYMENR